MFRYQIVFLLIISINILATECLKLTKAQQLVIPPNYMAYCANTNSGSPSYLSLYNDNKKALSVSIFLGTESWHLQIKPNETLYFPPTGPKDFLGLTLYINNMSKESVLNVVFFSVQNDALVRKPQAVIN